MALHTSSTQKIKGNSPYRVMVVDDSAIIRGFLSRYLSDDDTIEIVTTASNGIIALKQLERYDVEVVVLDIEMPEMDGLTALPLMLKKNPDLQVVMASTLTLKNADVSLRALQLGAVDYVPKPETTRSVNSNIDFRRELVDKVKVWAARRRKRKGEILPAEASSQTTNPTGNSSSFTGQTRSAPDGFVSVNRRPSVASVIRTSTSLGIKEQRIERVAVPTNSGKEIRLRTGLQKDPKVLAIGSSTGGPQALMKFFSGFDQRPSVPIVITQHMPVMFTAILAEHLKQATGWDCFEASEGMVLEKGNVYIAKGGMHMVLERCGSDHVICLSDGPPENFCKPSVDTMLRSMVPLFGDRILAVILTGMGHDGLKGAREVTKVGGTLLAQDEASSVVWGMPGAVATAGLCSEVLPLQELSETVSKRLKRCL